MSSYIEDAEESDRAHRWTLNQVKDDTSLVTKTPWLRHTQWEERFKGRDMKVLHDLTKIPDVRDDDARFVWDCIGAVLDNCWEGCLDIFNRGWLMLPFWLASAVRDKEDTHPFRQYIAPYTLKRYFGYWQSYILFCIRASELEEQVVEFTRKQRECLDRVIGIMVSQDLTGLQGSLLELSVELICHSDYLLQRSSLVYFTGVMGYNPDWMQWRPAHDYTTILAGLQFVIRIVLLEHALPTDARREFTEESPRNPVEVFCSMRNKWLIDGEGTEIGYNSNCRNSIWLYPSFAQLWTCCGQEFNNSIKGALVSRQQDSLF